MPEMKMIKVKPETHERLLDYATKGETFDEAINRLLTEAGQANFTPAEMVEQINWERDHPECMAKLPIDEDFRNALDKDKSPTSTAIIFELLYNKDTEYHARLRKFYMDDDILALNNLERNELFRHINFNAKWYYRLDPRGKIDPTYYCMEHIKR